MAGGCSLFFALLMGFSAMVLCAISCAGSTSAYYPIDRIFTSQINLKNLDTQMIFPNVTDSSAFDNLPAYVNVGLWSFCRADANGHVTKCKTQSGVQHFNLQQVLFELLDSSELESYAQVLLPSKLQDKEGYYNRLVTCMFTCSLLGICLSFITLCVNFVRLCKSIRVLTWIGRFLSLCAFFSILISAGVVSGTYIYIRNILNKNYSDYGIHMALGSNFYGIIWGSCGAALFNMILWFSAKDKPKGYGPNGPARRPAGRGNGIFNIFNRNDRRRNRRRRNRNRDSDFEKRIIL